MTKEIIMEVANRPGRMLGGEGGYVDTDGEWCLCHTPAKLKKYIESLGFKVVKATKTCGCSAWIETACGYGMAYTGFVCRVT